MDDNRLNELYNAQPNYVSSNTVNEAHTYLEDVNAGKPADYDSRYADDLGNIYDQIVNQGAYRFNMATDSLYNQYKNTYQESGQQAAHQTSQQAKALSGGWGNTWSGTQANQQYGEYLNGMNDILPQIEQNSFNAYNSETDRMTNLYNVMNNRDQVEYGRYRDRMNDWITDRDFAQTSAQHAWQNDYQQYSDRMNLATTMTGWNRDDTVQDRKDMYSWAVKLIGEGILPSEDILSRAGISTDDAIDLAEKYGYGHHSGSGKKTKSGSGKTGGTDGETGTDKAPSSIANFINKIKEVFG